MKLKILLAMSLLCVFQYLNAGTIYVKSDASGAGDGSSWTNAFVNLQPAIDATASGDQVWVAKGTYKPTSWPNGGAAEREKHFSLKNGVAVYGGFAGTETSLGQRNIPANETICSGDIGTSGNNTDNCYSVFYQPSFTKLNNTALLDGVTISDGNANVVGSRYYGGGMYNNASSPRLDNCTFSRNWAQYGGGMGNWSSSPILTNCLFKNNSSECGGGIGNSSSDSSPILTNCTFSGNSATDKMGEGGGGISGGSPTIINCTFSGNTAVGKGGGIYIYGSILAVKNSIFWGNTPEQIYNRDSTATTLSYCVVQNGYSGGTDIITTDPLLSPIADNGGPTKTCAIPANSSAVAIPQSAGSNNWNDCPNTDQRGYLRPSTGFRAMGAYDPNGTIPTFSLTYTAGANGTISGTTPQTIVQGANGTEVTAVPNTGYRFVDWSDGVLTAARTDTSITADISVTANFALPAYTLTYTAGANGTISGTTPQAINQGADGTEVTAVPNTDYGFVSWSDGVSTAARTDKIVTADINVTANFMPLVSMSKVKITLNSTADYKDMVLIMNAALPTLPAPIQEGSVVTVSIDGITFDTSAGFKQGNQKVSFKGDTSKNDRFSLIFDLKNKWWQFMLSKASISKQGGINYTDGVGIFVTVDGFMFGQNIKMDVASTIWKYSSDINGPAQNLPVMGTQWPGYDITKAEGKRFMTKSDRDSFSVKQAVGNNISFDPANDLAIILIDNYVIALSAADEYVDGDDPWKTTGNGNYTFRGTFEDTTKLSLSLNLAQDNGKWMFKMSKAAFNLDVDDTNDIDVRVVLGDYEGRQSIHASWITTLAYPKK